MSALPSPAGRTWPGWRWTRAGRRSRPRPGGRRTGRTRRRRCRRPASGRSAGRGRAPPATTRAVTPSRRRRWRRSCGDAGASRTGCAGYSTRCSGRTTAGRGPGAPGEAAAGGRGVTRAGSGQGADADQAAQGRVGRRRPVAGSPGNPGPRSAVALRSVVRRISPEPRDSPHNRTLLTRMPAVYSHPAVENSRNAAGDTHYRAFVSRPGAKPEAILSDGGRSLGLHDITDGMSNTLLVVEAAEPVPWTQPEGLPFAPNGPLPKLGDSPVAGSKRRSPTVVLDSSEKRNPNGWSGP